MAKKSKWPDLTRRVASDSFTVEVGGEEYHPHAGEYVILRQWLTADAMRVLLEYWSLVQMGVTPENADRAARLQPEVCEFLSEVVMEWNWTGPDGEAYPQPFRQPDVLMKSISAQELMWLVGEFQAPGEVSKNSPGGSTDS